MSQAINFSLDLLKETNGFTKLAGNPKGKIINGLISSDLLSHVIAHGSEHNALITVINNISTLGVASLLDLGCIIFTHNTIINREIIDKADLLDIPIFKTTLNTVDTIIFLYELSGNYE
ncbi:MAG: hypothetical protein QM489_07525 [Candidatus Izemoplasma sp.]